MLMRKAVLNNTVTGIKMKRRCPTVSHLLFVDDSLVFLKAESKKCANFMELMPAFSEALGLSLNVHKSSLFFSPNTDGSLKEELKSTLGMKEMVGAEQYLGLLAFWVGQTGRH